MFFFAKRKNNKKSKLFFKKDNPHQEQSWASYYGDYVVVTVKYDNGSKPEIETRAKINKTICQG